METKQKINWVKNSENFWVGSHPAYKFKFSIEFIPKYNEFFTENSLMSHKTLTGAKIAAAKTAHKHSLNN